MEEATRGSKAGVVRPEFMIVLFLSGVLFSGCDSTEGTWYISSTRRYASNEYFEAAITPLGNLSGYQGFKLCIANTTRKDIRVDWNNMPRIRGEQTSGGFIFASANELDNSSLELPDIVPGHTSFCVKIFPRDLACLSSGQRDGWKHGYMEEGENGLYLTVTIGEKRISERLSIGLEYHPNVMRLRIGRGNLG